MCVCVCACVFVCRKVIGEEVERAYQQIMESVVAVETRTVAMTTIE